MSTLTIRKIDPGVKERLRIRAARHGRSMEEEARRILSETCAMPEAPPANLAEIALELFGPRGGVELDVPTRNAGREPPAIE